MTRDWQPNAAPRTVAEFPIPADLCVRNSLMSRWRGNVTTFIAVPDLLTYTVGWPPLRQHRHIRIAQYVESDRAFSFSDGRQAH